MERTVTLKIYFDEIKEMIERKYNLKIDDKTMRMTKHKIVIQYQEK